jgi:hypothetical protein
VQKKSFGKDLLCRVSKKHSAKTFFAECQKPLGKDQRRSLPSVFLPSVLNLALGKELICRVLEKNAQQII